jgi:Fe-S cluster assembly protein SufD
MSLLSDTKLSTAQQLLNTLTSISGKNGIVEFEKMGEAIQYLEEYGIPTNKHEEYKYCNLDALLRKEFKKIENQFEEITAIPQLQDCINVYVLNGNFHSAETNHNALTITDIQSAQSNHKSLVKQHFCAWPVKDMNSGVALNTAFCNNGLFIHVPESYQSQKPICIHYLNKANGEAMIHPRLLIVAEENSSLTLIEKHYGTLNGKVFSTNTQEISLAENAQIHHYRIQAENENSFHFSNIEVQQNSNSNYTASTFTFGGALVRNNHHIRLNGKNAEANLNGLIIASHTNLIDNHTLIDHATPHCNSNEMYKGIANDKSSIVFNGKIMVRRDAQKTNAYQSSKNILLSDDATVNTKPQLEIFADDVKCSHGTSTGKVDEQALFYLKARGIGDVSARRLLLQAFAQELIDKIEIESLQEEVINLFENTLK